MNILIDTHIFLWALSDPSRSGKEQRHKDPFDRMLIAQSMTHNDPIMTEDPQIHLYACRIVPPFPR